MADTTQDRDEFEDLCDMSGVCLAGMHHERCISQMTFEQMRALDLVSS